MSLSISIEHARRFLVLALGLEVPFPSVADALGHLGFIQLDPINVCGQMHDLILRHRVAGYRPGDLIHHVHPEDPATARTAFEHYLPGQGILVTFPLEAWPFLVPHMMMRRERKRGYAGKLSSSEETMARYILEELATRGPLSPDDIEHNGRARTAWGSRSRAVKTVLEKLLVHGRVLIARRRNFRRIYDLPERVLPAEVLHQAPRSTAESQGWVVLQRLKQRRLVTLRRAELPLVGDHVQHVPIAGLPPLHCLRVDLPLLEQAGQDRPSDRGPRLLAPLDPLIYDRKLTRKLWDFDYTWEVYTPPAKRVRGYYALPLLSGLELVGHVDPKADRDNRRLKVVGRSIRRGHRAAPAVKELAAFLGLKS